MPVDGSLANIPMKVLATTAYPDPEPISSFRQLVVQDRFGIHVAVEDPSDADIILFVENSHYDDDPYFRVLRSHPWVREYREKCFLYNEHDRPWCILPGIYASMPARYFNKRRQRAGSYIQTLNPYVDEFRELCCLQPDLLFSFVGALNAPVRKKLPRLQQQGVMVSDTTDTFRPYRRRPDTPLTDAMREYARSLQRSRFVLCPRGVGTGSYRLFETMQAGRVPVVLSDQFVFPEGPEWNLCSVHVPERDVDRIPGILTTLLDDWEMMATCAREAWEKWFAPDVLFHRMINDIVAIRESRSIPESIAQRVPQPTYIEWRARALLRPLRDHVRKRRSAP